MALKCLTSGVINTDLILISHRKHWHFRDLKIQWWQWQWECQKSNSFIFARQQPCTAAHHFYTFLQCCCVTWSFTFCRGCEQASRKAFFRFVKLDMVAIQLEKSPPTFGKVSEVKQYKLRWRFKKYKSTFEVTFSLIPALSHLKVAFVSPTL